MDGWETAIENVRTTNRHDAIHNNNNNNSNNNKPTANAPADDGVRMAGGLRNPNNCRLCNTMVDVGTPAYYNREGEPGRKITCEQCHDANVAANPDAAADDAEPATRKKRAAKVRRLAPKLTPELLLSKRGLISVYKSFRAIKFKGRKHERADLKHLLAKYAEWAHELLPEMPFTEFVERLDKAGSNMGVKERLMRVRDVELGHCDIDELYDLEDRGDRQVVDDDGLALSDDGLPAYTGADAAPQQPTTLSVEQAARMERNRQQALERAAARRAAAAAGDLPPAPVAPGAQGGAANGGRSVDDVPEADEFPDDDEVWPDDDEMAAMGAFDYPDDDDDDELPSHAKRHEATQPPETQAALPPPPRTPVAPEAVPLQTADMPPQKADMPPVDALEEAPFFDEGVAEAARARALADALDEDDLL